MTITAELVSFICAVCGCLAALWFRVESAIKAARADAMLVAQAASTKGDILQGALHDLRVHVAETYVSKQGLREQMGQVMDLLRDVQNDVGSVNERLDRVIEGQPQRRSARAKAS